MSAAIIIYGLLLFPVMAALGVFLAGDHARIRNGLNFFFAICMMGVAVSGLGHLTAIEYQNLELFEFVPGIPIAFHIERLGFAFSCMVSILWFLSIWYSIGYLAHYKDKHQKRFFVCFALAIFSVTGIALSANLLTLFVFYELLTLSTYPLVTHYGNEKARKSGRIYLALLLGTSVILFFPAVVAVYVLSGNLAFQAGGILPNTLSPFVVHGLYLVFCLGVGKAALMPFHRWLPNAMVAPAPVSALLHAVAVVKGGVFTILKVTYYIFGLDLLQSTGSGESIVVLSSITLLLASLIAMRQDNLKLRLAYSTISQLSYIVLGAALASTWGMLGGSMHLIMHAFGKITLFFCAGAIAIGAGKTRVSELDGLGKIMPVTMGAFLVGSLSIIGLPPAGGFWSKFLLMKGSITSGYALCAWILLVSSLLNIAYLLVIPIRAFFKAPIEVSGSETGKEAPLNCLVPLSVTACGTLVLFLCGNRIYEYFVPMVH